MVAQDVEQGQVGDAAAVGEAAPFEIADVLAEALPELVEEAALADAGLAGDPDDLAEARDGRAKPALQQLQVVTPADERGEAPARPGIHALPAHQPGDRTGHALDGADPDQIEAALQERRRRGGHEDPPRLRVIEERGHHRSHGSPRLQVQLRRRPRPDDRHRGRVEGELHREGAEVVPASPLGRPLDGEGGVRRAQRCVVHAVQAEHALHRGAFSIQDAAAEARDLLDQRLHGALGLRPPACRAARPP